MENINQIQRKIESSYNLSKREMFDFDNFLTALTTWPHVQENKIYTHRDLVSIRHSGTQIHFALENLSKKYAFEFMPFHRKENPINSTIEQVVALEYSSMVNKNKKYAKEIINYLNTGVIGFTGVKYVPNEGVYIEDYPEITRDSKVLVDENESKFIPIKEYGKETFIMALMDSEEGFYKFKELENFYGESVKIEQDFTGKTPFEGIAFLSKPKKGFSFSRKPRAHRLSLSFDSSPKEGYAFNITNINPGKR